MAKKRRLTLPAKPPRIEHLVGPSVGVGAQLGVQLMKQWNLPLILENNILFHHNPSEAQQPVPATIIHLADIIANSLGIGSSGEKFVPSLDCDAWENFDISPSSFVAIIGQATHQFHALESILHA